ncbi:MAG: hypothetical protein HY236_00835 [Acidobacteria bacterium]|nr:hypothetical protein [Acidobacteriota bacterium]
MEIIGHRKYVEIPGDRTHELPPLLVRGAPEITPLDQMVDMAANLVESEEMISDRPADNRVTEAALEQRKFDLAINLAQHYLKMIAQWRRGDSVLEWIRQCEITFESKMALRNLLRPDLWPHAGRSSFVRLLEDKSVPTDGVVLENAVGLRLTFRQPPPISCFSDQFLLYLNSSVAATAYQTWARLSNDEQALLPPERFHFQVLHMTA